MPDTYDKNSKYINIYNRIYKQFSGIEFLLIIKKQYFTNNICFYILCIFFRFIPLFILSGDYISIFIINNKSKSLVQYFKKLTCYSIIKNLNCSYSIYSIVHIIIFLLFITRIIVNLFIIKKFHNYKYTNKWPLPNKYIIIIDHIIFLFFPYIIEFLSFSFYIYFFPEEFIIKYKNGDYLIYFLMIISLLLIIAYNIENYFGFICLTRKNSITIFDAYYQIKKGRNINNIFLKVTNFNLYIILFLENFVIFFTLEYYLNYRYILVFKIIVSIIMILSIIILYLSRLNELDHTDLVNLCINILMLFCFYSIIIDFIIFLTKYFIKTNLIRIIYILFKLFISCNTYILLKMKAKKYLEKNLIEILFQERNNKNENDFINSLYYLHQKMLEIKQKNEIKSILLLDGFLNIHINKCNKSICNCKILKIFIDNKNNLNNKILKFHLVKLLNILNYLFECSFVELDYCNNYDLSILLSEHFCHLRNNPIMAFSLINTLIINQKNKLSKIEKITLFELSQKYIYFLKAKIRLYNESDKNEDTKELLKNKYKNEELLNFYYNLKISNQIKKYISNYIDNQIKIIKYKTIFEDSLSFQYDESNEYIISVKINFFEQSTKIEDCNSGSDKNDKIHKKKYANFNNLFFIVNLLNKEHLYYFQILNFIYQIEIKQNIPIFLIFKFILFFDIFEGGTIPERIGQKLYNSFLKNVNLYNGHITSNEYTILIKRYKERFEFENTKHYAVFEYKKELRTKYYSENFALKLGFKQNELINKSIDELMPKDFANSHQNLIKQLLLHNQLINFDNINNYFFDKTTTIIYCVKTDGILIYNITKNLNILFEWEVVSKNEYIFMLNSNYDLISSSKNFEEEYYLNQNIFQKYNINLLDILKLKQEKLYKIFRSQYSSIKYQKILRQIKTEEYFIPQIYLPHGERNKGIMDKSNFNICKNNIISKISNISTNLNEEKIYENKSKETRIDFNYNEEYEEDDDEKRKLIKKSDVKNLINDLFLNKGTITFHNNYITSLNKLNFVKNLSKQISKIEDNDLNYEDEKDKKCYYLLLTAKKLLSTLMKKFDISNNFLKLEIKLSYYYDKPFYYIIIDDQKKICLGNLKKIIFENDKNQEIKAKNTSSSLGKNSIPYNKSDFKSRNKQLSGNYNILEDKTKKKGTKNINLKNKAEIIKNYYNELENNEGKKVLHNINEYRHKINKDKFIYIVRLILSIIIVAILLIYILVINYSRKVMNNKEKALLAYFYNSHTRDYIINIYSELLQMFYDHSGLAKNPLSDLNDYQNMIYNFSLFLKNSFHNFSHYCLNYNLHNRNGGLNFYFQKRKFKRLRGFWIGIEYESELFQELEYIIYNLLTININNEFSNDAIKDRENFIFFKERNETHEKPNTSMIRILYYLCNNYEFVYSSIFDINEKQIYNSSLKYSKFHTTIFVIFEYIALFLFIIFFIVVICFLYCSNEIIIKNIIFVFLDFSEEFKNKNINSAKIISLKLQELQYLINDFSLNRFEKYTKNLENINKSKPIYSINNESKKKLYEFNNNLIIEESKNEVGNKSLNQSERNTKSIKSIKFESSSSLMNKKRNKKIIIEQKNNSINNNDNNKKYKGIKNSKSINNSSQIFLVNSQISKDKLINKSISTGSINLTNNNDNDNDSKNNNPNNFNKNIVNGNNMKKEKSLKNYINDEQESIQDIILRESKKYKMLLIKIYSLIIFLFIFITIGFSICKIIYTLQFNSDFNNIFINFAIISNRYNLLYYFFNTFRTLLIFPENERKKYLEDIMEYMIENYENENNQYNNIILNEMKEYKEITKLIEILKQSKEGCIENIKNNICLGKEICLRYLNSKYNIFDSGIDFIFQSSLTQLSNLFMEYKNLKNKTDINIINSTVINSGSSTFMNIGLSLNNLFNFIKEKIFESFIIDEMNFKNKKSKTITLLNLIPIISSIISFLFINIFIFISLYRFSKPIKESAYRINCSFYNIKKYKLSNYKI